MPHQIGLAYSLTARGTKWGASKAVVTGLWRGMHLCQRPLPGLRSQPATLIILPIKVAKTARVALASRLLLVHFDSLACAGNRLLPALALNDRPL